MKVHPILKKVHLIDEYHILILHGESKTLT